ncbi:MAG: hypothetical protein OHK0039_03340 [Bacteroidia bacterium]
MGLSKILGGIVVSLMCLGARAQDLPELIGGLEAAGLRLAETEQYAATSLGPGDWLSADSLRWTAAIDSVDTTGSTLWLRFALENTTPDTLTVFLQSYWNKHYTWLRVRGDTLVQQVPGGSMAPHPRGRPVEARHTITARIPGGETHRIYVVVPAYRSYGGSDPFVNVYDQETIYAEAYATFFERRGLYGLYHAAMAVMLFQLMLALGLLLIVRRISYLYYALYVLCLCTLAWLQHADYLYMPLPAWIDRELAIGVARSLFYLSYLLYLRFVRVFLELPVLAPGVARWIRRLEYSVWVFLLLRELGVAIHPVVVTWLTMVYATVFFGIVLALMVVLVRRLRSTLVNLLLAGSAIFALFAFLNLLSSVRDTYAPWFGVFPEVNYFLIGCIAEILFFSIALVYKLRLDEQHKRVAGEKLLQQIRQNAQLNEQLQAIRERIARDLHDEIGATLSSIGIYTEVARRSVGGDAVRQVLDKISTQTTRMIGQMREVVWAIDSRHERADALVQHLRDIAATLLGEGGIAYTFRADEAVAGLPLDMDQRRHLTLLYKEALTNLQRHSAATQVSISLTWQAGVLQLVVRDEGQGFDPDAAPRGNGLLNMQERADLLGAGLSFETRPGAGTCVTLRLPLPDFGE